MTFDPIGNFCAFPSTSNMNPNCQKDIQSNESLNDKELYKVCHELLNHFKTPSYKDLNVLCAAMSSNLHDSVCMTCKNKYCHEWIPRMKLYFFHSLAYDPVRSCFAERLIRKYDTRITQSRTAMTNSINDVRNNQTVSST